jgi:hypothetical protein
LNWRAQDAELLTERPVEEPRTVKELSRCAGIAIGRWLMSGIPCPDWQATDGVSIEEADMELAESES